MKIGGWICIVLGSLSLLFYLVRGDNPIAPTFFVGLGLYLVYRINRKKQMKIGGWICMVCGALSLLAF